MFVMTEVNVFYTPYLYFITVSLRKEIFVAIFYKFINLFWEKVKFKRVTFFSKKDKGSYKRLAQGTITNMCIRDLGKLNLIWWFEFRIKSIFKTAPTPSCLKNYCSLPKL